VAERFWEKVNKSDGCWEWQGALFDRGYGVFQVQRRTVRAHRLAYMMAKGPIAPGLFVCHMCDNPRCVRPEHLFLGTPQENTDDMVFKGRARYTGPKNPPRREEHHKAKLDELSVQRLRAAGNALPQIDLAAIFGVSKQTVSAVLRYECWRSLGQKQALA
jgi:hypothetical protein